MPWVIFDPYMKRYRDDNGGSTKFVRLAKIYTNEDAAIELSFAGDVVEYVDGKYIEGHWKIA